MGMTVDLESGAVTRKVSVFEVTLLLRASRAYSVKISSWDSKYLAVYI